jgi:hypothetical protein
LEFVLALNLQHDRRIVPYKYRNSKNSSATVIQQLMPTARLVQRNANRTYLTGDGYFLSRFLAPLLENTSGLEPLEVL